MLKNIGSIDGTVYAYKTDEYGGYSINISAGPKFTLMESQIKDIMEYLTKLKAEEDFRKNHPPAQDAYEKYQTIVALCSDYEKEKKTA
jgi:hypothetical protein